MPEFVERPKQEAPAARKGPQAPPAADHRSLQGLSYEAGRGALGAGAKGVAPEPDLSARIESADGEVRYKLPRALDWTEAKAGDVIPKGAQVSTGEGSSVSLRFSDGSDMRLGDNALLVIYGGSVRKAKTREQEKTQVILKEGTVKGGLSALDDPRVSAASPKSAANG